MADTGAPDSQTRTLANARKAERKRMVARAVKDAREQLTSTSGTKRAFDYEMTVTHVRTRFASAWAVPLLVVMVALVATLWVDRVLVVGWAVITLAAHGTVLVVSHRFLRAANAESDLLRWRRTLVALDVFQGLSWAFLFALPTMAGSTADVFHFSSMLIVVAVGIMLTSNVPPAMFALTLPITLATSGGFILRGLSQDNPIAQDTVIALMALGVQVFFILLGYRLYHASLAAIASRAEKDSLIVELEQANAISDESRRKAEEANLAKSRFLATMSHELRTPLNAILGFSEVITNEILGPIQNQTYKDYIVDIHRSGQHLLNLINEILDLSRIEAGRYKLNEEAVTLLYSVEDCVHMMSLRAKNKGITILEQYEEGLPKIWADERAIRQVTLNILSNAVKFTPTGGTITVKVGWTAGGGQYVAIRDTGPGIPEEEIPIVLSAFGQGSIAIKSAEQGTGLGLNIVQALVQMHGGSFDLKSKLREGTEVLFTIPSSRVLEIMPQIHERPRRQAASANPNLHVWSTSQRYGT